MSTRAWLAQAACRDEDPEIFYPAGETAPYSRQVEDAKTVCRRCPVRPTCLQWAIETKEPDGVWGGATPAERRTFTRIKSGGAS